MTVTPSDIFALISFLVGVIAAGVPAYVVVFGKLNHVQGQLSQLMQRLDVVDKHADKIGQIKSVLYKHKKDIDGLGSLIRARSKPPTTINPKGMT